MINFLKISIDRISFCKKIFFRLKSCSSSFFKYLLNGVIAFQLAFYPCLSTANGNGEKAQQNLKSASQFNKKYVESLRKLIFDSSENSHQYYKNHPLDSFALLGQNVHKINNRVELESFNFVTRLQNDKKIQETKPEVYQKIQELVHIKNSDGASLDFYRKLEELLGEIYFEANAEKGPNYQEHIYRHSKKIKQKLKNKERIKIENIIVTAVKDTKQRELTAVLAHPDRLPIAKKTLEPDKANQFKGSHFQNSSQDKLSFELSYHGKSFHSFPQNIEWISFFKNYLIFLEPSKVSENKALISFIDLKYFESALGKTALPIFHIPIHFQKAKISKEYLLSPSHFSISEGDKILIGDLSLSLSQIDYISKLQQLAFNATVSMIDPSSSGPSQTYLREILQNFETSLSGAINEQQGEELGKTSISLETKKIILKMLDNRRQIGSSKDVSGNYGTLNKLAGSLSKEGPEEQNTKDFKDSLMADKSFQASVDKVYKEVSKEQKFWNRAFVFLNHFARPQPLGAPKIKKALGLIANSVSLKGDTVQNRWSVFKESLSQAFYPRKNRFLAGSVLTGLGIIASPEVAQYYLSGLEGMGNWLKNWGELFTVTGQTSFEWISQLDGIHNAYLKGDKPIHLMKGLTALLIASLLLLGIPHLGSNYSAFKKHIQSKKEKDHQEEAQSYIKRLKSNFISYMEKERKEFIENLSNAEKKKLGILIELNFGLKNIKSRWVLKTNSGLDSFYSGLESAGKLSLELSSEQEGQINTLELKSSNQKKDSSLQPNQILLSLNHNNQKIERLFTISQGELKRFLNEEQMGLKPDLSPQFEISGKSFHTNGVLQNADFSEEENFRLNKILSDIETETGKILFASQNEDSLSKQEIKTLSQALLHLALGYSSWAKTFRALGLGWNWWFLTRSSYISPSTLVRVLYYSKYFKVTYDNSHIPTVFNGGEQARWSRDYLQTVTLLAQGSKNSSQDLENFEKQMIEIEKTFLKEVEAAAYLELIKQLGENADEKSAVMGIKKPNPIHSLSKGPNSLQSHEIKNKKLRIFYQIYKRELFRAVIRDYLYELTGVKQNVRDGTLKKESLLKFVKEPDILAKKIKKKSARQRVERVAKEQKITQISLAGANNLVKGFLKRGITKNQERGQKIFNPKRNLQIQRFSISKKLLNDPEALARATRQQMTYFTIDKPIELLFTFLFLAGVDQGILQILQDKPFTEEAWFHLSRYAIWSGFFAGLILEVFASAWFKVQQDSRLDETKGFEILPEKTDIEKKAGYLQWLKKQFMAQDNSLWENNKHYLKIIYANLPAAFITIGLIQFAVLGRFDLEIFISAYLAAIIFFLGGLDFKIENIYEKSVNWVYKDLIKRGLDLTGKDRHFLSHPVLQQIKIKEGAKLRRRFNLWLALLFNNPAGNVLNIFANIDTSLGSRAFSRMFFFGSFPTEYWVNFMDFLENKNIISSDFAGKCKSIFTNNRTDL